MVDQSTLESHLWESANILRGPVDAADLKTYIFPLLFFKRVSDVYDEEVTDALKESGGDWEAAFFPENHRFQIPDDCHWIDIRERAIDVGQALQYAFREIEKTNQNILYGIFGDAQWSNKERLSDPLLVDLIDHFSRFQMGNKDVESDILGRAYEYLIKKFSDGTNKKKAGEFYTPHSVVELMVNILDLKPGEAIYDPACGTGGMLLEAVKHVREEDGRVQLMFGKFFGREKNLTTANIAHINLLLNGIEDFSVIRGDTLRQPAFFEGDHSATFDCVIVNPPFSLKKRGREIWINDPYGSNLAGLPTNNSGDFAWIQHMLKSMAVHTGRMAVVLHHGALFRMGAEGKIRRKLLERDLIEGVIGLGPNLFYGTGLAASILVFRDHKSLEHQRQVLIIDASNQYRSGRNQNTLESEHLDQIFSWYSKYQDVEGAARVVTLQEIAENNWNLNIPRYVDQETEEQTITGSEALENLKNAMDEANKAEDGLRKLLVEAELFSQGD